MKREILFRGKDKATDQWVYGDYTHNEGLNIHYISRNVNNISRKVWEVDPDTVGQYTEFKDKNGKKVFEGDLLEVANRKRDKECIADVIFLDGAFLLHFPNEDLLDIKEVSECWVVIGNIHDNPV